MSYYPSREDKLIKNALRNCDIKSQHELNTCNDGNRSSDVLVEAISKLETTTKENELFKEIIKDEMIKNGEILEEIERLQKQLDIAVKALEEIEKNGTNPDIKTITVLCVNNFLLAHKARIEIEELNNDTANI